MDVKVVFNNEIFSIERNEKGFFIRNPFSIIDRKEAGVIESAPASFYFEGKILKTITDKRGREVPIIGDLRPFNGIINEKLIIDGQEVPVKGYISTSCPYEYLVFDTPDYYIIGGVFYKNDIGMGFRLDCQKEKYEIEKEFQPDELWLEYNELEEKYEEVKRNYRKEEIEKIKKEIMEIEEQLGQLKEGFEINHKLYTCDFTDDKLVRIVSKWVPGSRSNLFYDPDSGPEGYWEIIEHEEIKVQDLDDEIKAKFFDRKKEFYSLEEKKRRKEMELQSIIAEKEQKKKALMEKMDEIKQQMIEKLDQIDPEWREEISPVFAYKNWILTKRKFIEKYSEIQLSQARSLREFLESKGIKVEIE